jgi:C1A family cysteine protease
MTARNYRGWIRDKHDPRDHQFKPKAGPLRPQVERLGLGWCRIEDQLSIGSCTGQSSTSALEIAMGYRTRQLSRLFPYFTARVTEGTVNEDAGAMIRDVIKGLMKVGTPTEPCWPYDVRRFADKPSKAAYQWAGRIRNEVAKAGVVYQRVADLNGLLHALNDGCPVVFGFSVIPEFEALPPSGLVPMPGPRSEFLGGHAVVAVGYDIPEKFVWVQNSWGKGFGIGGYFKMPFGYFGRSDLVDDLWAIRKTPA